MPDDRGSLAELRQLEVVRRLGFMSGNPHQDLGRLVESGFTRPHAQRLLSLDRKAKGLSPTARQVNPEELLAKPLNAVMESLLIPQKAIIAPVATLAQGGSIGEAGLSMLESPITSGRTFGEIPGAGEKLGTGGVLALDLAVDPIFFFSGGLRQTGRLGKALTTLESARVQVSAGDFLAMAGQAGTRNVGKGTPIFKIREILDAPEKVALKGRSPAATKKWIRNVEKAYGEFSEGWRKKGLGEPPEIDHVFVGPKTGATGSKVPTAGELIRQGSAGIFTAKVPFAPEVTRMAPFQRMQARIADGLEGTLAGNALGLDRQARFLREVASASKAQAQVAQLHTQTLIDDMRRDLEGMGIEARETAVLDRGQHILQSRGILEAGGQERILAGRHADPSRLAEVHEMLYQAVTEGRVGSRLGRNKSQEWIERLGVLVEEDASLVKAHKALNNIEEPAVRAVAIDPEKAPNLDLQKINRWGKESRLRRFRQHYEKTVDPATGKGNFRAAYTELQSEIQGGIRRLVAEVYGLAPNDPVLKVADALEDTYMRLGMSELTAGTLGSFGKGYFPRAVSPFGEHEIRRHLEQTGMAELKRKGASSETIADFNTFLENSRQRGFAHLTQMQVEDLFRRGKMTELVGGRPSMENFARYAEQVGADTNPGIASFMDIFSGVTGKRGSIDRAFHRKLVRTDPQAANFYLSDPIAMGAKRWGTGVARIKAQEFTDSILDALGIEKITQLPNEGIDAFSNRIGQVMDQYKEPGLYQAVISTRKLPREAIEQLKALGAEIHQGGIATLPRMSAELAAVVGGVTKPRKWKLEATVLTKEQAVHVAKQSGRFSSPTELQGFWREIERLTSFWKQWALFPRPAYHSRNFISNTWLMFQAGMRLDEIGLYYLKAARLDHMVRKTTPTLARREAGRVFTRGEVAALEGADNIATPGFVNHPVLGPLSAEDAHLMRINSGVIDTGFLQAEDARSLMQSLDDAAYKKSTSPLNPKRLFNPGRRGTIMSGGQLAARQIEGLSRTAMYLWALEKKGLGMSDSAAVVFEHLFNYNDLHKWERQLRSTAIPFWSWIRNNIPRQLKSLVREPGKTLLPVKAVHSLRAQADMSEELEPDFIEEATGWPIRTFRDARGRQQIEIGYMGTNFPIADLVELSKAMGTAIGVPMAGLGLISRGGRVKLSEKQTFRRGIAAVLSNVNPILTAPVEAAANISFFRMKQIEKLPGGHVRIPWLGDYVTTPMTGQLLAMIPFLREVAGAALQTKDFRGNPMPVEDRVSRLLTGSPKLFRQGPAGAFGLGGRLNVDVLDAKTRAISREERGIERETGYLRGLVQRGVSEASDFERFQEILRIRLGRLKSAAGATTGRL